MPPERGRSHRGKGLRHCGTARGGVFAPRSSIGAAAVYTRRMKRLLVAVVAACALVEVGAAAPVQPNDPAWPDQWAQRQIGLPQVWETTTGDPNIVIATIDTGVNAIPDLQDAMVPGWDFVENDAVAQDTHGHGTRVASVIAARGNNQLGMAGHCWGCRIMPVRVTAGGSVNPERIASGIVWAVQHGARIINVSLSHVGAPNPIEREAVRFAIDSGVLVVASAGNDGNDRLQYPAAYPGVISVGATDDTDKLYFWSSARALGCLHGARMSHDHRRDDAARDDLGTSFTPARSPAWQGSAVSRGTRASPSPGSGRHSRRRPSRLPAWSTVAWTRSPPSSSSACSRPRWCYPRPLRNRRAGPSSSRASCTPGRRASTRAPSSAGSAPASRSARAGSSYSSRPRSPASAHSPSSPPASW